jgi:hypothetical protein
MAKMVYGARILRSLRCHATTQFPHRPDIAQAAGLRARDGASFFLARTDPH